jgi:hypothetical protein
LDGGECLFGGQVMGEDRPGGLIQAGVFDFVVGLYINEERSSLIS